MLRSLAQFAANAAFKALLYNRFSAHDQLNASSQANTLFKLLIHAKDTQFGQEHGFAQVKSVRDYQQRVPLRDYDAFWRDYWQAAFPHLRNVTWPGLITQFCLSSGTTTGSTKYIPLTQEMMRSNEQASLLALHGFYQTHPDFNLLNGRFFFLGGSTEMQQLAPGVIAGDLSGIVTQNAKQWMKFISFPPAELALLSDWEQKVERFAEASSRMRISAISGVPSWMLILFAKLKEVTGKSTIAEIWPELGLVIHGGTKFDPYRQLFQQEIGSERVRFLETYPASEGFIAYEDKRYEMLRLVLDNGIFYEFVPWETLHDEQPVRHTLATLETGVNYAVVLTTNSGLWSYLIGDTVMFESKDPPLLRFTGRTKYYLSAFGEHLISEEVERAVSGAAEACGVMVLDFHVGPFFPTSNDPLGGHRYFLEFNQPPENLGMFQRKLDGILSHHNEDYAAHRSGGTGMATPRLIVLKAGAFAEWMRSQGKLGGQHKVPRMDNTAQVTDQLEEWMQSHDRVLTTLN